MPFDIKKVGKKFQVINSNTGYIHSKGTTKKKAEAQVRLLHSISGDGMEIGTGIGDYFNTVLYGRNDLPPLVRNKLRKWGNEPIVSINIGRTPLGRPMMTALELASGFTFAEKLEQIPYEKLFHLFLGITTTRHKFTIEKNEVVNMGVYHNKYPQDTEFKQIQYIPEGLTMNEAIEKQRALMGGKFLTYSAKNNNCQDFVKAFLEANQIGNSDDIAFVKQDTLSLFEGNDTLRKISNSVTDLGAKINEIVYGSGNYIKKTKSPRKEIIDHKQSYDEILKAHIDNIENISQSRKKVLKKFKSIKTGKDKEKDKEKDKDKLMELLDKILIDRYIDKDKVA
jgi:hypothetical protein